MVESQQCGDTILITLHPNRSANWSQNKWLLAGLGTVMAIIACGWASTGLWLILPFAGLEFTALLVVIYLVCERNCHRQLVRLEQHQVVIQQGRHYPALYWRLSRPAARLQIIHPDDEDGLIQVILQDDHSQVEIGRFLNSGDRKELYRRLRRAGLGENSNKWWRQ